MAIPRQKILLSPFQRHPEILDCCTERQCYMCCEDERLSVDMLYAEREVEQQGPNGASMSQNLSAEGTPHAHLQVRTVEMGGSLIC